MDTEERDEDAQGKIEGNEEFVESAPRIGEKPIKDTCQGDGGDVHSCCRTNQDPLPQV